MKLIKACSVKKKRGILIQMLQPGSTSQLLLGLKRIRMIFSKGNEDGGVMCEIGFNRPSLVGLYL